ncbi:peptide-methionine (R)-S-oxide reductase MsrB [Fimbriimonas ginsengisoli]|nr:peptide-methionine (R)-S-oxide reductase MsrB [Fimbriimonas ginsengisoli]
MVKSISLLAFAIAIGCATAATSGPIDGLAKVTSKTKFAVTKADAEWKRTLAPDAYLILRKADTERAYSGKYWDFHGKGTYLCAACDLELFSSDDKFDSQTGWPSFTREIKHGRTLTRTDLSDGMERDEVVCSRCGSHLGHVFDDGPEPTHLRFCMNSPALKFKPKKSAPGP